MDLTAIMKNYAEQIGGQFTQYDSLQSIVIMPVSGGRFQTVLGTIKKNELYNRQLISLNSKVCSSSLTIDYKMLLEQTAFFNYCRFVINQNYLQVEAVASLDNLTEETIKEMLQEVANLGDQYEMKLTGSDIH
ncbi:MAG: YbjN domain-containing protein [Flammeovirgaceae bacterium]|jgi:predicted lactoylglutathione lyase|nr:YbjN domain-containing protein [Flammeovirgaceae bacterium]